MNPLAAITVVACLLGAPPACIHETFKLPDLDLTIPACLMPATLTSVQEWLDRNEGYYITRWDCKIEFTAGDMIPEEKLK
jgi:hypothetical protein